MSCSQSLVYFSRKLKVCKSKNRLQHPQLNSSIERRKWSKLSHEENFVIWQECQFKLKKRRLFSKTKLYYWHLCDPNARRFDERLNRISHEVWTGCFLMEIFASSPDLYLMNERVHKLGFTCLFSDICGPYGCILFTLVRVFIFKLKVLKVWGKHSTVVSIAFLLPNPAAPCLNHS